MNPGLLIARSSYHHNFRTLQKFHSYAPHPLSQQSAASAASHKGPVIYHSSGRDRHAPQVAFPPAPIDPPALPVAASSTDSMSSAYTPNSAHSPASVLSAHSPASVLSSASAPTPTRQHRRLRNSVTDAFGSVRVSPTMKQFPAKQRLSVTEAFGSVQYHRRRNTAPTNVCLFLCAAK